MSQNTSHRSWRIPRRVDVALAQHGLDDAAQAAHRPTAPVPGDGGVLGAIERWHPVLIEAAFPGEVGHHGRQKRIEIAGGRFRERQDAKAVADRRGQRIEAIGGRDVGNLGQVERGLQGGVGVANAGFGLEEAEQAVPQPAVVRSRAGLLELVDQDQRVADFALRNREEGVARLGRIPAAVGAAKHRAVGAGGVLAPDANAEQFPEATGEPGFAAAGIADEEQGPQPDRGAADEIGERKVDGVEGVGEFEDQRIADLVQRRHLDQRQGHVDDAFQGADDLLELRILHLVPAQTGDHEVVFGNGFRGGGGPEPGRLHLGFPFLPARFPLFHLPPGRGLGGVDPVFRHAHAEDGGVRRRKHMLRQQVGCGRQRRPAEHEPFDVAAELLVAAMDHFVKGLQ